MRRDVAGFLKVTRDSRSLLRVLFCQVINSLILMERGDYTGTGLFIMFWSLRGPLTGFQVWNLGVIP